MLFTSRAPRVLPVLFSLFILFAITSAPVDAGEEPVVPVVYLPMIGNPPPLALSRVYYTASPPTDGDNYEIFSINPDGTGARQLTSSGGGNSARDVSPDGHLVLFTSSRSGNADVWVMDSNGGNQRMLLGGSSFDNATSFSPDASKVLLVSNRNGVIQNFIINVDGTGLTPLPQGVGGLFARFSPDGTRIAYYGRVTDDDWGIFLMNADGSNSVQLTYLPGDEQGPIWSRDGSTIYFNHRESFGAINKIAAISVDGTQHRTLYQGGAIGDVSPDGTRIAFHIAGGNNSDLYTMKTDGTDIRQLTDSPEWDVIDVWGPSPR